MRTIRTKVYTFNELNEKAKEKAILGYIEFLMEFDIITEDSVFWPAAEKMTKLQTPWFLAEELFHNYKDELIEGIGVNCWEYLITGEIIPNGLNSQPDEISIDTAVRISKES